MEINVLFLLKRLMVWLNVSIIHLVSGILKYDKVDQTNYSNISFVANF